MRIGPRMIRPVNGRFMSVARITSTADAASRKLPEVAGLLITGVIVMRNPSLRLMSPVAAARTTEMLLDWLNWKAPAIAPESAARCIMRLVNVHWIESLARPAEPISTGIINAVSVAILPRRLA